MIAVTTRESDLFDNECKFCAHEAGNFRSASKYKDMPLLLQLDRRFSGIGKRRDQSLGIISGFLI